ncbi:PTS sugar transporter subunit IIB [Lactiplantibacillus nangangensis]|uniref:PTS sugar transporter subunit IIB n=1 Tax=Lactiplantibacillus nangangensis TaxID=2559917 RepID=A0ABW1SFJ5_9LACO|nr:PTS sugar transporter subunit IIB [Lactiplantibacillus nangangensis]
MKQMNILLVCAGGMSTSILMKKLQAYSDSRGINDQIKAVGLSVYEDVYQDFDVVLLGPQVSYRMEEVQKTTNLPTASIPPLDYAVGNSESIFKLAEDILS